MASLCSVEAPAASEKDTPEPAEDAQPAIFKENIEAAQAAAAGLSRKRKAREAALVPVRPDESELRKLDSSVKRNTALVKRLRQTSEETASGILEDISKTNQSRYVSEGAAAISEANLRQKDVAAAMQVCSVLHQRYEDFGRELGEALAQQAIPAEEDRPGSTRRRALLRLLSELLSAGVCSDARPLVRVVEELAARLPAKGRPAAGAASSAAAWHIQVLPLVAALAKGGREELLRLPPRPLLPEKAQPETDSAQQTKADGSQLSGLKDQLAAAMAEYRAELEQQWHLPEHTAARLLHMVSRVFEAACEALEVEHAALVDTEMEVARVLNSRGDVPEDMGMAYEQQRRSLEALQRSTATLGEALGRPVPHLPQANVTRITSAGGVTAITTKAPDGAAGGPFEDAETKAFYESLPDLRGSIPAVLLGDAARNAEEEPTSPATPPAADHAPPGDDVISAPASEAGQEGAQDDAGQLNPDSRAASTADLAREQSQGEEAQQEAKGDLRADTDALLRRLPHITTAAACDELAASLACVCSKAMRRRLVKALTGVKASHLQLLPFYIRIGATLNALFPDIGQGLVKSAEDDFHALLARRDGSQQTLQARVGNGRLLGELAKFRLIPLGSFFTLLKALLDDFTGPNIDTSAALVESAGRFLYLLPEAHTRMANMLEVMKKMKGGKNLDARQRMLLDDAAYACVPPAHMAARAKQRPPLEAYMRHLVLHRLWIDDPKKVMRKLRRFPWAQYEPYLVRCLLRTVKGSYAHIATTASVTAALSRYHPSLGVRLADCLLEEVRAGLEMPQAGAYQRRVGHMRLLGELYNYRIVDSKVVFAALYQLLEFGHETPESAAKLDPPDSYFRLRLACQLLEACGHYFAQGSARVRLERFLLYLQRYLLAKPSLPFDVEFDVQELLENLRPDMARFDSFEAACQAVAALEAAEARQGSLDTIAEEDSDSDAGSSDAAGRSEKGPRHAGDEQRGRSQEADQAGESDEEQAVRVLNPIRTEEQEADPAFEAELAALMGHGKGTAAAAAPAAPAAVAGSSQQEGLQGPAERVAFRLVMRRGGSAQVQLPSSSAIAASQQAKAAAEAKERAEMKRLVLQARTLEPDTEHGKGQAALPKIKQPAAIPKTGAAAAASGRVGGRDQAADQAPAARGRGRRYSAGGA